MRRYATRMVYSDRSPWTEVHGYLLLIATRWLSGLVLPHRVRGTTASVYSTHRYARGEVLRPPSPKPVTTTTNTPPNLQPAAAIVARFGRARCGDCAWSGRPGVWPRSRHGDRAPCARVRARWGCRTQSPGGRSRFP